VTTHVPAAAFDLTAAKAAEEGRWRRYAQRLSPLCGTLAGEFRRRSVQQGIVPLAVFARADGTNLILAIPPGADYPLLLADDGKLSPVLEFSGPDEPGPERLIGDLAVPAAGDAVIYTLDADGSDRYLVRVRFLGGRGRPRTLATDAGPSLAWDPGSERVLFTALNATLRPATVCSVGLAGGAAEPIYTAAGDSQYLDVRASSDGTRVLVTEQTHSSSRVWLLGEGGRRFLPLSPPGADGGLVRADCWAGRIALIQMGASQADRLYVAGGWPPAGHEALLPPVPWRAAYQAPDGACLEDLACAADHVLVVERTAGGCRLIRVDLAGRPATPVTVGGVSAAQPAGKSSIQLIPGTRRGDGSAEVIRESWQSPATWFRSSPDGRTAWPVAALGQTPAPSVRPSAELEVTGLTVPSAGGLNVPVTLLRPPGRGEPLPTVLYAYGSYGVPVDPGYNPFRESLIDRGVAFAIAHVRGGGDLGSGWHEAGRGLRKPDAVADYLAAARYLVDQRWAPDGQIVARARSAGAVVVGAAINQAPTLFRAAVLETPFLDCLQRLLDPDAALVSTDWDEWGNPGTDSEARAMLTALSPLDNVRPAEYPAILLTAGERDTRILAAEPLRFAAAVRAATTSARDILVRIDDTGHLGHSAETLDNQDEADILAFILDQLGLARPGEDSR